MKKRLLAVLFILLMFVMAGCQTEGKKDSKEESVLDPDNPTNIIVWHYYNGVQQQEFDELVQKFNDTEGKEKGIVVEAYSQSSVDELYENLKKSLDEKVGAEEKPDVFSTYADTAYSLDQEGLLADLSQYITEEELSKYVSGYLNEGAFNQKGLKLFPIAKSTEVLELNKTAWDAFAADTGASLDDLKTWEGIAKVAEQYYNWSDGQAFFGRDAMANYMLVGSAQLGKEIWTVGEDGKVEISADEEIFKKLWDNYYVPYINGYYLSEGKFRSDDAKVGKIIACVASSSSAAYFPSEVTDEDGETKPIEVLIMETPNFEGKDKLAVQQGASMAVLKSDEKKEYASVQFLKWITDVDQNVDFSLNSGYLPVKQEANDVKYLEGKEINSITKQTLEVTLNMTKEYNYYTTQAFDNAYNFRNIVGCSMQDKAAEDKEEISKLEKSGTSHEDAVAKFNTEDNFKQWYEGIKKELEDAVK